MGSIIGKCFPGNNRGAEIEPPRTGNQPKGGPESGNPYKGPEKSRVNEQDKAILEVKARLRKLKTYIDKLTLDTQKQQEKIYEQLKAKNKNRALIALKQKKFYEKELDKCYGAQTMLQQTIQNIESAQVDVEVFEALKKGDQVLTELQQKAKLEDFEELYEKHQEHLERQEMERELFGQVMDEDELQDELDKLDEIIMEREMPAIRKDLIEADDIKAYQEKNPQQQQFAEEEKAVEVSPKKERQLAYA